MVVTLAMVASSGRANTNNTQHEYYLPSKGSITTIASVGSVFSWCGGVTSDPYTLRSLKHATGTLIGEVGMDLSRAVNEFLAAATTRDNEM